MYSIYVRTAPNLTGPWTPLNGNDSTLVVDVTGRSMDLASTFIPICRGGSMSRYQRLQSQSKSVVTSMWCVNLCRSTSCQQQSLHTCCASRASNQRYDFSLSLRSYYPPLSPIITTTTTTPTTTTTTTTTTPPPHPPQTAWPLVAPTGATRHPSSLRMEPSFCKFLHLIF